MSRIFVKYKFFIICIATLFILRLPSLFEPYWYGDEGIYLTLGLAIRKGLVLYRQIHDNKPPTLYYMAALGQTVFGFRLLLFAWMIPTIFYFYRLSLKFLKPKIARIATFLFLIITSIPLVEGNIANAEIFMLLPTILGALFLLNATNKLHLFISGILLGFAFTIKVPVAFEFSIFFLWLIFKKIDFSLKNLKTNLLGLFPELLMFTFGFILPISLFALYYLFQGAFPNFLFAALLQNFGYLSSWSTGSHSAGLASGGLPLRAVLLLASWLTIFILTYKKMIKTQTSFLLFWLSATVFGALLSARPYPHYLLQVLPPLVVILGLLVSPVKYKDKLPIAVSIVFLLLVIFKYQFYFYPNYSYYQNYYSHLLGLKSKSDYLSYFPSNINTTYQLSQFIKQNTTPDQKIFIWGDEPYVYALSQRLPIGRFTVAYHIVDFNGYQQTIDNFQINLPQLVVTYPMSNRPFPALDRFLARYYFVKTAIGPATVFQLR